MGRVACHSNRSSTVSSVDPDPQPKYIYNGRSLAEWVHYDFLYQAYHNAALILLNQSPATILDANPYLSPSNPYKTTKVETGFATFGGPACLLSFRRSLPGGSYGRMVPEMAGAPKNAAGGIWWQGVANEDRRGELSDSFGSDELRCLGYGFLGQWQLSFAPSVPGRMPRCTLLIHRATERSPVHARQF